MRQIIAIVVGIVLQGQTALPVYFCDKAPRTLGGFRIHHTIVPTNWRLSCGSRDSIDSISCVFLLFCRGPFRAVYPTLSMCKCKWLNEHAQKVGAQMQPTDSRVRQSRDLLSRKPLRPLYSSPMLGRWHRRCTLRHILEIAEEVATRQHESRTFIVLRIS